MNKDTKEEQPKTIMERLASLSEQSTNFKIGVALASILVVGSAAYLVSKRGPAGVKDAGMGDSSTLKTGLSVIALLFAIGVIVYFIKYGIGGSSNIVSQTTQTPVPPHMETTPEHKAAQTSKKALDDANAEIEVKEDSKAGSVGKKKWDADKALQAKTEAEEYRTKTAELEKCNNQADADKSEECKALKNKVDTLNEQIEPLKKSVEEAEKELAGKQREKKRLAAINDYHQTTKRALADYNTSVRELNFEIKATNNATSARDKAITQRDKSKSKFDAKKDNSTLQTQYKAAVKQLSNKQKALDSQKVIREEKSDKVNTKKLQFDKRKSKSTEKLKDIEATFANTQQD